jgi:hypothetical protein
MASPWEKKLLQKDQQTRSVTLPLILSASRRTDIPAFFADAFMRRWQEGIFPVPNPYNPSRVEWVSTEKVRIINFWTKDGSRILPYLPRFMEQGLGVLFLYTLNDYEDTPWERSQSRLVERLETFKRISLLLGKEKIRWRFDPIILTSSNARQLLDKAQQIASALEGFTTQCIFSFLDMGRYSAVRKRMLGLGQEFVQLDEAEKIGFASKLKRICDACGITAVACSEKTDFSPEGIGKSSCIDGNLIARLFPHDRILQDFLSQNQGKLKDENQRPECGCIWSKDIGTYGTCGFDCAYCYARR